MTDAAIFHQFIGDMLVVQYPGAKLLKAAAVIAANLHQALDNRPGAEPGKTKNCCVVASLTARDFLQRVGFQAARVDTVCTVIRATLGTEELHSAAIGHPDDHKVIDGKWSGHVVVKVDGFLIDTTLYQVNRPAWPQLPGMIMLKIEPGIAPQTMFGLKTIAGVDAVEHASGDKPEYRCSALWLDNPSNRTWKAGPDAHKDSRMSAVKELVQKFTWRDRAEQRTNRRLSAAYK